MQIADYTRFPGTAKAYVRSAWRADMQSAMIHDRPPHGARWSSPSGDVLAFRVQPRNDAAPVKFRGISMIFRSTFLSGSQMSVPTYVRTYVRPSVHKSFFDFSEIRVGRSR